MRFSKRHWCYVIKLINWCNVSADFTLVERNRSRLREKDSLLSRLNKLRCISFNNTYSLMVQGNNVSFVVSENTSIRNSLNKLKTVKQSFFLKMDLPITLYRNKGGPSSLQERGHDSCLRAVLCYKQLFTKAYMGFKRFFLKERKNVMFFFKESTYLIALLYSLLFARVSGRFEAFSAS